MPPVLFFLKIALAIWIFYGFIQILELFIFCEKCHFNVDKNCVELYISFGSMDILTIFF